MGLFFFFFFLVSLVLVHSSCFHVCCLNCIFLLCMCLRISYLLCHLLRHALIFTNVFNMSALCHCCSINNNSLCDCSCASMTMLMLTFHLNAELRCNVNVCFHFWILFLCGFGFLNVRFHLFSLDFYNFKKEMATNTFLKSQFFLFLKGESFLILCINNF